MLTGDWIKLRREGLPAWECISKPAQAAYLVLMQRADMETGVLRLPPGDEMERLAQIVGLGMGPISELVGVEAVELGERLAKIPERDWIEQQGADTNAQRCKRRRNRIESNNRDTLATHTDTERHAGDHTRQDKKRQDKILIAADAAGSAAPEPSGDPKSKKPGRAETIWLWYENERRALMKRMGRQASIRGFSTRRRNKFDRLLRHVRQETRCELKKASDFVMGYLGNLLSEAERTGEDKWLTHVNLGDIDRWDHWWSWQQRDAQVLVDHQVEQPGLNQESVGALFGIERQQTLRPVETKPVTNEGVKEDGEPPNESYSLSI